MKSKAVAAWLAVLLGALGAHRVYLRGPKDPWAYLHLLPSFLALWGLREVQALGTNAPHLTWALPLGCAVQAAACLQAIVLALTSDAQWEARWAMPRSTHWGSVLAAVAALLLGGICLMTAIVYTAQRYFELSS